MYNGSEIEVAFSLFICVCFLIFVFVLILVFVSNSLIKYNNDKADEIRKNMQNRLNKEIIAQGENHHIIYTPETNKKEEYDFNVDFNVELNNSIVKTEIVYAD